MRINLNADIYKKAAEALLLDESITLDASYLHAVIAACTKIGIENPGAADLKFQIESEVRKATKLSHIDAADLVSMVGSEAYELGFAK